MAPKRSRAHSPGAQTSPKKKSKLPAAALFIDDEAEEANSVPGSEDALSQLSDYSQAQHLQGESTLTDDEAGETSHAVSEGVPVDADITAAAHPSTHAADEHCAVADTATPSTPTPAASTALASQSDLRAPSTPAADASAANQVSIQSPSTAGARAFATNKTNVPPPASAGGAAANPPAASSTSAPSITPPTAIDPTHDWGFGTDLNRRIHRLMSFNNTTELIYDVNHVPTNNVMVRFEDFDGTDDADLVSVPGRKAPITVWIVGIVTRAWFRDREGNLAKSVSINIRPLHDSALHAANALLRKHTTYAPGENPERYDTVRAQRWMNKKKPGDLSERTTEFSAAYDARDALLSPRERMPPVYPPDIKKGDLVLLELYVGRYRKKDGDSPAKSSSPNRKKDAWTACFTLKSVCLLDDTERETGTVDAPEGTWEL